MTKPDLLLGTAMWGWSVTAPEAFRLLDEYYEAGFRQIDGATNYPINKNPEDFRAAEKILLEWIRTNGVDDLKVLMKIGSINNLYTPDHNLSPGFIKIMLQEYRFHFETQLDQLMIHWDNREDASAIRESMEALEEARALGLRVGLSGIKQPAIYARLNEDFQFDFDIQFKHNLIYSDYSRYKDFHGKRRFLAYGINAGGLKFKSNDYHRHSSTRLRGVSQEKYQAFLNKIHKVVEAYNFSSGLPPIEHFNQCSLVYTFYSPDIKGILLGPSRLSQLKESLSFFQVLQKEKHKHLFDQLLKLKEDAPN